MNANLNNLNLNANLNANVNLLAQMQMQTGRGMGMGQYGHIGAVVPGQYNPSPIARPQVSEGGQPGWGRGYSATPPQPPATQSTPTSGKQMNQYFSEGGLNLFMIIDIAETLFQQGQTHLRREQLGRRQASQRRWRRALLLMPEKEGLSKNQLVLLFLHLKMHLPRCKERWRRYLCLLDDKQIQSERPSVSKMRRASENVSESEEKTRKSVTQ